jgi:hypothetical protein
MEHKKLFAKRLLNLLFNEDTCACSSHRAIEWSFTDNSFKHRASFNETMADDSSWSFCYCLIIEKFCLSTICTMTMFVQSQWQLISQARTKLAKYNQLSVSHSLPFEASLLIKLQTNNVYSEKRLQAKMCVDVFLRQRKKLGKKIDSERFFFNRCFIRCKMVPYATLKVMLF